MTVRAIFRDSDLKLAQKDLEDMLAAALRLVYVPSAQEEMLSLIDKAHETGRRIKLVKERAL